MSPGARRIRSVATRELRSYFNSPIAYIFLLSFVGAALRCWRQWVVWGPFF